MLAKFVIYFQKNKCLFTCFFDYSCNILQISILLPFFPILKNVQICRFARSCFSNNYIFVFPFLNNNSLISFG